MVKAFARGVVCLLGLGSGLAFAQSPLPPADHCSVTGAYFRISSSTTGSKFTYTGLFYSEWPDIANFSSPSLKLDSNGKPTSKVTNISANFDPNCMPTYINVEYDNMKPEKIYATLDQNSNTVPSVKPGLIPFNFGS